jgi:hypothetical protein
LTSLVRILLPARMDKYQKIDKLGSGRLGIEWVGGSLYLFVSVGTYGVVYKARNRESGQIVALKRIRLVDENEVCLWGRDMVVAACLNYAHFRGFHARLCERYLC